MFLFTRFGPVLTLGKKLSEEVLVNWQVQLGSQERRGKTELGLIHNGRRVEVELWDIASVIINTHEV